MDMQGLEGKTYNIHWSKTRYETWDTCLRKGAYQYLLKVEYKIDPVVAKGLLHHQRQEEFWYPWDYKVKKRRGQPKFDLWPDAEAFAKATRGMWLRCVKFHNEGHKGYQKVNWKDPAQPYWMKEEIGEEAKALYSYLSQRERPFKLEFTLPDITIEGVIFTGRPDILDKPLSLEDLKTMLYPTSHGDLKYNPQFTVYVSMLSAMCANPEYLEFAKSWGVNEEQFIGLKRDPLFLIDKIKSRQLWLPTRSDLGENEERKIHVLDAPPREPTQLPNLIQNIWNKEEEIAAGFYPPREGKWCDYCNFKARCDQDTMKHIETRFPVQHSFLTRVRESKPQIIDPHQLKIAFPKNLKKETDEKVEESQIRLFR